MSLSHVRNDCRLCGSQNLIGAIELTPTPPANAFVPEAELTDTQECFPLDVLFCQNCGHMQLRDVVNPEILYRDYVYVSGTSPSFVKHFDAYAEEAWNRAGASPGDLVVEVGSNDGTLLKAFARLGARVKGVDPARDIAATAAADGIPTLPEFFSQAVADGIRADLGEARIVAANNVCAHIDDLRGVVLAAHSLLADGGLFVFEVSYRLKVIEDLLFDTIYHEHLDYHAVGPLARFLRSCGLTPIHVDAMETHGGSIRLYARKGEAAEDGSIAAFIDGEEKAGLYDPATYRAYADRIAALGTALRACLGDARAKGRRAAGYGAPAKTTTLMYHLGLGSQDLAYIVDDSPLKQGLFTPGLHIPVVSKDRLLDDPVDDLLILAWNFAAPIMNNNSAFAEAGGRFIIPLPELEVAGHAA